MRLVDSAENRGSIIPFSSGGAVSMNSGNISRIKALIGFGTNVSVEEEGALVQGSLNLAFIAPRSGIIYSISCMFLPNTSQNLGNSTVTISAGVYVGFGGPNTFYPTDAVVNLAPTLTGNVSTGSPYSGTATGLSIPVTAGYPYLFVCYISATPFIPDVTLTGYISGGININ